MRTVAWFAAASRSTSSSSIQGPHRPPSSLSSATAAEPDAPPARNGRGINIIVVIYARAAMWAKVQRTTSCKGTLDSLRTAKAWGRAVLCCS